MAFAQMLQHLAYSHEPETSLLESRDHIRHRSYSGFISVVEQYDMAILGCLNNKVGYMLRIIMVIPVLRAALPIPIDHSHAKLFASCCDIVAPCSCRRSHHSWLTANDIFDHI